MLLIAHQSLRNNRSLREVARELGLSSSWFDSHAALGELLEGQLRRILVLGEADLSKPVVQRVCSPSDKGLFGVIIAGDSKALRSSDKAGLVEKLTEKANLQWIPEELSLIHI